MNHHKQASISSNNEHVSIFIVLRSRNMLQPPIYLSPLPLKFFKLPSTLSNALKVEGSAVTKSSLSLLHSLNLGGAFHIQSSLLPL